MSLLERIDGPDDLRSLRPDQMPALAEEIRRFLVEEVSRTGGHLGPNLGVVELTIAIHRVFDSPRDTVVFDTGHQSYVHKLLTGRHDFTGLRTQGGLSGYPSRAESEHDVVENSHASASLSWAAGIATGRVVRGERDRHTRGGHRRRRPHRRHGLGGPEQHRGRARPAARHRRQRQRALLRPDPSAAWPTTWRRCARPAATSASSTGASTPLARTPVVGGAMYETLHGVKKGIKDIVAPQGLFEDLGLKYLGPVDGHDEQAIETALRKARAFGGPVLVHVLTQKGRGYDPAITDEADQFHAVGVINPETGLPLEIAGRSWTDEFSDEMVRIGARPPGRRRDHRRDDDPGRAQGLLRALPRAHLRRRHRRAARADHGGRPGVHRAAPGRRRLRDLPQPRVRPAAHGLRACTRPASRSCSTAPASPAPTAPRTTACGT